MTTPAPDSVTTSYEYDAAGETTQSTDGAGNVTGLRLRRARAEGLNHSTRTRRLDTVTYDPAGNVTAQASLATAARPLAATSATYDGEGDKLSATDANGNTTTFTYDPDGRPDRRDPAGDLLRGHHHLLRLRPGG